MDRYVDKIVDVIVYIMLFIIRDYYHLIRTVLI